MGKTQKLEWEHVASVGRGPLRSWESLYRARFGQGWLLRYMFHGGRDKSGSSVTWLADPEAEWTLSTEESCSEVVSSKRTPNHYEVLRQFNIEIGSVMALAAGTRNMFWTDVVFVPKGNHESDSEYIEIGSDQPDSGPWGGEVDELEF